MSDTWSRCALRISSKRLSCWEITKLLGTEPSSATDRGEPISRYAPDSGVREVSTWLLESGLGPTHPLQKHLESLLRLVGPNSAALQRLSDECTLEVFCGFSSGSGQGGFMIDSATLKRIGEVGLDLVLDLYPAEREG